MPQVKFTLTLGSQGVHGIRKTSPRISSAWNSRISASLPAMSAVVSAPSRSPTANTRWRWKARRQLGRPVKWVSDRTEHFLADAHGRDNDVTASLATDKDGRILGLKIDLLANMGAYLHQFGPFIPALGATMSTGVYDIQNLDFEAARGLHPHHAAGRLSRRRASGSSIPDRASDGCGGTRDRNAGGRIQAKNFIKPEQMPYLTPGGRTYDVGEFDGHMTRALEKAGQGELPRAGRKRLRPAAGCAVSAPRSTSRPAPLPAPSRPS
jgi:carbon-monoxide dehydrogenase large subunit